MAIKSSTLSYFQELEALKDTDEAQNEAFMDLLVFTILADAEITDQELEQLDDELTRLPFLWDKEVRERVVDHSANTREHLEQIIGDPEAVTSFVEETTAKLTERDHQVVALRMMAAIALADGITEAERDKIYEVGHAFHVSDQAIEDVIEEVAEHMIS